MKKFFYIQKYTLWQQSENQRIPDIKFIPSLLARRLTKVEKIGLFLTHELEPLPETYQIVFASRFGEWQQTIDLIQQFFNEKEMSPAGFSHSVHNAMPGMLSVLAKNMNSYTSIAAKEWTIENALIESFCAKKPVLFVFAEEETPVFYQTKMTSKINGQGVAFIISDTSTPSAQKISVEFKNQNIEPLSFDALCQFLKNSDALAGSQFVIRKI